MKHNIKQDGYSYKLSAGTEDDAQFIIDVRLKDKERNKYVHEILSDIESQYRW